jgi:plasmid stabilization system protein ParE
LKVVWSPTARRRALEAVDFIAHDRPLASAEWLNALIERVDLLRDLPEQGRVVPEWGEPSVREIMHEPFRVVYEVFPDRVEILTLSHFRQELPG